MHCVVELFNQRDIEVAEKSPVPSLNTTLARRDAQNVELAVRLLPGVRNCTFHWEVSLKEFEHGISTTSRQLLVGSAQEGRIVKTHEESVGTYEMMSWARYRY